MPTYKVLSNLKHDGDLYKAGDEVEMSKSQAASLLDDGVLSDPNAVDVSDDAPTAPRKTKAEKSAAKAAKNKPADKEDDEDEDDEDAGEGEGEGSSDKGDEPEL